MENKQFDQAWIGLEIVARLAQEYQDIEEVTDPVNGENVIDGEEKTGREEIEEVIEPLEDSGLSEGDVFFRNGVTAVVLSVWVVWNLIGLMQYMKTGNTVLLLTSPAVLSVPLHKVLGYHFRG